MEGTFNSALNNRKRGKENGEVIVIDEYKSK